MRTRPKCEQSGRRNLVVYKHNVHEGVEVLITYAIPVQLYELIKIVKAVKIYISPDNMPYDNYYADKSERMINNKINIIINAASIYGPPPKADITRNTDLNN